MLKKLLLLSLFTLAGLAVMAQNTLAKRVNGQVLVKLKPAVESHTFIAKFATQSRAGGGVWVERRLSRSGNIHLMKFDTNSVSGDVLMGELKDNPQVETANFDYTVVSWSLEKL